MPDLIKNPFAQLWQNFDLAGLQARVSSILAELYTTIDEAKIQNLAIQLDAEFAHFLMIVRFGSTPMLEVVSISEIPEEDLQEMGLDGIDIEHLEESELAQIRGRKIGFIFQSFNLIPNLTAKENVMLPMLFQGKDKIERETKAEELLNLVELGDRMEHYPNQLSGGQQQRVAIARSLANDPEVILADEPTGNLDTKTGEKVMGFLQNLNNNGKTIIMVTHSAELAQEHARTIYWVKDGKVEKVTKKVKNKWKVI